MVISGVEDSGVDRAIGNSANDEPEHHATVKISHMMLLCVYRVSKALE